MPDDNEPSTSKDKTRLQLKEKCLDDFRFYSNAPDRSYTDFQKSSQLTDRLLRLMLCSKRIFNLLGSTGSMIYSAPSTYYISGGNSVRYYTPSILVAARLIHMKFCAEEEAMIIPYQQINDAKIEGALVKLIYYASKEKIRLILPDYFRTRLVDQLIHDLGKYIRTANNEEETICLHYGVDYLTNPKRNKDKPYSSLTLINDIGESKKAEIEHIPGNMANLWNTQKKICIRQPYLDNVFLANLTCLQLNNFNYLTIHEYFPLPSMPHLTLLQADVRLQDVCDASLKTFVEVTAELKRVSPRIVMELESEVCINSRSFDRQINVLNEFIDRINMLRQCISSIQDPIIFFEGSVDVHLPMSEQARRADWTNIVSPITEYYRTHYEPSVWRYETVYLEPPQHEDRDRIEFRIYTRFIDEVLTLLGEKDIQIIE